MRELGDGARIAVRAFAMLAILAGAVAGAALAHSFATKPLPTAQAVDKIERCLNGFPRDSSDDLRGFAITNENGDLRYCILARITVEGWSLRK